MKSFRPQWLLAGLLTFAAGKGTAAPTVESYTAQLLPAPAKLIVLGEPRKFVPSVLVLWSNSASRDGFDPAAPLRTRFSAQKLWIRPTGIYALALSGHKPPSPVSEPEAGLARSLGSEGYLLDTGSEVRIISAGRRGLYYGAQTLAQLLAISPGFLPSVRIEDRPDFSHREIHIHGFDKGYGAGDLKSLTAYTDLLPQIWPTIAQARFNTFRYSIDAGWLLQADQWIKADIDGAMRRSIGQAHASGVDALVEVRWAGLKEGPNGLDYYALDPVSEWPLYEKALRRALSWGPDIVDVSFNDLPPLNYPDVLQKYGVDGRFSPALMTEVLEKAKRIVDEVKPGTKLAHLPRFYGEVHWQRYPNALPTLAKSAPAGTLTYITAPLTNPQVAAARAQGRLQFVQWINFTSNHTKELKILLNNATPTNLRDAVESLPSESRQVVVNLGYPVEPQRSTILATGEMLWNTSAYDNQASFAKAALRVWGSSAPTFEEYARQLDFQTVVDSRGINAAELLNRVPKREVSIDQNGAGPNLVARWSDYVERARKAEVLALGLEKSESSPLERTAAKDLFWNAKRIELDAQIGLAAVQVQAGGTLDRDAVLALISEAENVLKTNYPVEPNDPKSAEVSTRGLRGIRAALDGSVSKSVTTPEAQ